MNHGDISINVSGGQFSLAKDNATIHVIQNNSVNGKELNDIIKGIDEKEETNEITAIAKGESNESVKPKLKVSRLKNRLTLIASTFTIANGVFTLADNLQKLKEFIIKYING